MRYHDMLVMGGRVERRYEHNTDELAPAAVIVAQDMIQRLKAGDMEAGHGVAGLPDLTLQLGLPDVFERFKTPGRFFTVSQPGAPRPFSVNLVVPADRSETRPLMDAYNAGSRDAYDIMSLFGISMATANQPLHSDEEKLASLKSMAAAAEEVWKACTGRRAAPCLLTTLMVSSEGELMLVQLAADFVTVVAGAHVLESAEENR